jgi:hypothetical protein
VEVRYDEGLANRVDPEPCAPAREGRGEASAGARIGQPLSRERYTFRAPTLWTLRKAMHARRAIASARLARRGRRPWHVRKFSAREPGGLASDRAVSHRAGPHRRTIASQSP